MAVKMIIRANTYQDSVALMRISSQVSKLPGIVQAAVVMGTAQNKEVLQQAALYSSELDKAKPSDLIVAFDAEDEQRGQAALKLVDKLLAGPSQAKGQESCEEVRYKSIRTAIKTHPEINMVSISTPGLFAGAEAYKALKSGANVFLFSDNISLEDEIKLKKYAWSKGLIVMGPDCGTAYISGVPFGFVNKVQAGTIGIIGSSGTGIQEIMCQIHRMGSGISHIIGTGGRDLSAEVGGLSTRSAIAALEKDNGTETIILVSKPPDSDVANEILELMARTNKRVIACLLGYKAEKKYAGVEFAATLQEAAQIATGVKAPGSEIVIEGENCARGKYIRGLFSGGTLASESYMLMKEKLGTVYSNIALDSDEQMEDVNISKGHTVLDMGSDEFTVGKPHPIMDLGSRLLRLKLEADDSQVGVILMDLVLGYSAHPDPAGELAPYIRQYCGKMSVVINLIGTDLDKQSFNSQAAALKEAGAVIAQNNSDAVALALKLCGALEKGGEK